MLSQRPRNEHTALIFLGIVLVSVAVRLLTAEYVDIGGDNFEKWHQVNALLTTGSYTFWYQQTVRWGILLPLAGLMKAFGLNPVIMYVQPVLYSSLAAGLVFLIGQRLHSRELGVTAALAAIVFPQMAQTGSQLWPGVFELFHLCLCLWLILIWLDTRSTPVLALAAVVFFLGWGCRVTMIYAAPGLALLLFLPTFRFRPVFLFFLIFGVLCTVEWAVFRQLTGNPMGRIGIIAATHLKTAGLGISLHDYLLNIKAIVKLKGLVAVWALCLIAALHNALDRDPRWRALGLLYAIHAFLLLYMLSSFSPLKLAMPVGTRFWGVIAPVGLLLLVRSLFVLRGARPRTAKALLALVFIAFLAFTAKKIPPVNSLVQLDCDYRLLAPLLAEKKPILMHYEHWQPDLIESKIISLFTGTKGKRVPREDHVLMAIQRNEYRTAALFVTDVTAHDDFIGPERLKRVDYTSFLLVPKGCDPATPPAAEVWFGRKLHRAEPLP
ncbi:glycosyltransferase family 39 protein [Pseudodesulfovibrio sp.]|uniref:glycosyltransferase family 39 protein n=1 Tax=Pseudodesulfovibrio sp. TaxID=2035812 RepID=UPI00263278F2|nr:glycosyltransferase family 39 protein [Pseudodesulfovibrio sp.]MDD3311836.1 glycosyltransferase family 39 protein [Pseudodesulfovibrio sp.]